MRVVVLAGGTGRRLGYPGQKCCIPIAGRPFLHWKLDELYEHGADAIDILVHHHTQEVIEATADFPETNLLRDPGTGPWDAIRWYAFNHAATRSFIVTYGDTLLDVDFPDISSSMYVTRHTGPHLTPNLLGGWIDAGVYRVRRDKPLSHPWTFIPTPLRPWTINTPEQYAETEQYLASLRR